MPDSSTELTLVPLPDPLYAIEPRAIGPKDTRSYTRRLTLRNAATLSGGKHPATGLPLLNLGKVMTKHDERCGNCKHLTGHSHDKTWYKCGLVPMTFGPGTDIRLKWPACVKWERQD